MVDNLKIKLLTKLHPMNYLLPFLLVINSCFLFVGLVNAENPSIVNQSKGDIYQTPYKFLVAGHTYSTKEEFIWNQAFYAALNNNYSDKVDFIILNGDFIDSGIEKNRKLLEAELQKYSTPFYFVTGNHEKSWADGDSWNRKEYLTWLGRENTYYSFFKGPDLFLVFDGGDLVDVASPNVASPEALKRKKNQVDFIKQEIKKDHRSLFIFVHEILWLKEFNIPANSSSGTSEVFWSDIVPLLNNLGKEVFIFGGDVGNHGKMFDNTFENIRFISSGFGHETHMNNIVLVKVGGVNASFELATVDPTYPFVNGKKINITRNLQNEELLTLTSNPSLLQETKSESQKLKDELQQANSKLHNFEASRIWKATKLLRIIINFFKSF